MNRLQTLLSNSTCVATQWALYIVNALKAKELQLKARPGITRMLLSVAAQVEIESKV
jgi:hypothetical protein